NVVELDLGTAITTDGTYAFAIDSASPNGVSYKSAASVVGQKPILLVTVASGPAPSVQIVQPPDGATFFVGDPVTLQGTATDMAGDDISASPAWPSDRDGLLGTGGSFRRTLSAGMHRIAASVTDGGSLTGSAELTVTVEPPVTVELKPVADAYVDAASASANFGASSILSVSSARTTFLRFAVTGVGARQVVHAALRLQADASSAAGSVVGGTVRTISNATWGERTITSKTRPAIDGPAFGAAGPVKPGQIVELD